MIRIILGLMVLLKFSRAAESRPTFIFEVRMTITDLDNRPIPNIAGRLLLGKDAGWQSAHRGVSFETGSNGKTILKIPAQLHDGSRKRPTNFVGSLLSGKESTDDLLFAVELTYAGEGLLYAAEVHRFRDDGTVLLGDVSIFSKDAQGDFTVRVPRSKDGGWLLPQLHGLAVTTPGYEIADFLFHPDESDSSGKNWILNCQFKRFPTPVLR